MAGRIVEHEAWPKRALILAALGALLGFAFDLVVIEGEHRWTEDPLRTSAASLIAVAGISFAFTLERLRWRWSLAFALVCGLTVAAIFYWNGSPGGWSAGDEWRIFSALLAVAIAAPLFQTIRDEGRWVPVAPAVHAHAWTNIVLWFASWAFVLITWLLAQLLAELFHLIGIELLREATRESWFNFILVGAALGGAAGLLRDRDTVLGLLQRVVTTVLSVLAPVLAGGLALFVLALPVTGLAPLWEKTSATTPILLGAIAGAFILLNAVIGNSPDEEAKGRALRASAMVLGAVMTPLALVAAVSTWLRIDQHGFTPERLWALVFVIAVLAVSLTYLWALVRGRAAWSKRVRPANVALAVSICAVALILATPLVDFGAMSTRDQLARLYAGKVKPDEFDWAALRFDFGPAGRRALERLAGSGPAGFRAQARKALKLESRWAAREETRVGQDARMLAQRLRVVPGQVPVPQALLTALARQQTCGYGRCTLFWTAGAPAAVAVGMPCENCQASAMRLLIDEKGGWRVADAAGDARSPTSASTKEQRDALEQGRVEIRSVQRQQVFVGGKPVGPPFEQRDP
jgi:hypothetical protein